jgi:hypothetical protein
VTTDLYFWGAGVLEEFWATQIGRDDSGAVLLPGVDAGWLVETQLAALP